MIPDSRHPAGSRCVFLREDNFCGIQATSVANGRSPWELKPFYCALYPVIILGDLVLLDDDNDLVRFGGTCLRETTVATPLYKILESEIILALGKDGYAMLDQMGSALRGQQ